MVLPSLDKPIQANRDQQRHISYSALRTTMCPQSRVHPHLNAPPNTTFLTLICTLLSHHHSPCCQTAGEDLCMDNPAAMLGKLCIMYGISASTLDFKPWKKGISNNLVIWHKKHVVLFKSDSTH